MVHPLYRIADLSNEQLQKDTQLLVDEFRSFLDDCERQRIESGSPESDPPREEYMQFSGMTKMMVDACETRGIKINTTRAGSEKLD